MLTLQEYLERARSPFQAVKAAFDYLVQNKFAPQRESQPMDFSKPGVYTRDGSALVAWIPGTHPEAGFVSIESHTDSPVLRLRQDGVIRKFGSVYALPVENYSSIGIGRLLDRRLCVGGRVTFLLNGSPKMKQIDLFSSDFFFVPSLAVHMLRNPGDPKEWVPEGDELCVCCPERFELNGHTVELRDGLKISEFLMEAFRPELGENPQIVAHEIDFTAADQYAYGPLFQAARLDNLASVYASVTALVKSYEERPSKPETRIIIAYNHEEIGSQTRSGAHGPMLREFWARFCAVRGATREVEIMSFAKSLNISADGAHGAHPVKGASSCQEPVPILGNGFCFKLSQRQNYAFTDYLIGVGCAIAKKAGVPYQIWAAKTYKAGGGTIGNIVAADTDARVIDCGIPMLGMHSCMETIDMNDLDSFFRFFMAVFEFGNEETSAAIDEINE